MNFKLRKLESVAVILGTLVAIVALTIQILGERSGNEEHKLDTTGQIESIAEQPNLPPNNQFDSKPSFVEVSQITANMTGNTINTRGVVTILNENKGNVYFNLKDPKNGKEIRCVMFAKTNNNDPQRKVMLLKSRDANSVVNVKGEVNIYKDEIEIKVWQVYL